MAMYLCMFERADGMSRLKVIGGFPTPADVPEGAVTMDVALPWPSDPDYVRPDAPAWCVVGHDSGWLPPQMLP